MLKKYEVSDFLPLVKKIVSRLSFDYSLKEDLIQVGLMAVDKALKNNRNDQTILKYITKYIIYACKKEIRESSLVINKNYDKFPVIIFKELDEFQSYVSYKNDNLNDLELELLKMYLIKRHTQKEIAEYFNISQSSVSRILQLIKSKV